MTMAGGMTPTLRTSSDAARLIALLWIVADCLASYEFEQLLVAPCSGCDIHDDFEIVAWLRFESSAVSAQENAQQQGARAFVAIDKGMLRDNLEG